MAAKIHGYHGVILEVDLTTGKIEERPVPAEDYERFVGGRGLGMKMLWDRVRKPGVDPLSPENPLLFMPGPFSGFPVPASSRTCVVTKSPQTSPVQSPYAKASTVSYANMGGFFGPEIRFAGYDGIVVTGKASYPAALVIEDGKVEIREARKFWGKGTDAFDKAFIAELGDRRFRTCYIGPAGENLVPYACIINTAGRAAGRGGTGCVMGSKNLKAIAVKGSKQPDVGDHKKFLALLEDARRKFNEASSTERWRKYGTAAGLERLSGEGIMAVKNFREGTFTEVEKIGASAAMKKAWIRHFACFCCPLSCKKSGVTIESPYAGLVHDGPEYETGTMLGANLMVSNLEGMLKAIYVSDDYGLDIIACGNVIGFLMEAYEKKYISSQFLDGIDLAWGNVDSTLKMIDKIAKREGIGDLAAQGVKVIAAKVGRDSAKFAMHVKGHELAAHNVHANPPRGLCYATANRGGCHLNGGDVMQQNSSALLDSTGLCRFATGGYGRDLSLISDLLSAITGVEWTPDRLTQAGERIFNLEKMFNYREGFRRQDDRLPDRFFEEPLTIGKKKGAVLKRDEFKHMLDQYYQQRGWDLETTCPGTAKLKELGLDFTVGVA
jgi:aldehyde:ferredoxin oxidoreductase